MNKLLAAVLLSCLVQVSAAELAIESTPNVIKLPADYPDSWIFAHDANFSGLIAGKVIIVDVSAESHEYKGAIGAAQFATFMESSRLPELYVGETFYSRGTTGTRTDVVSIYDKSSLEKQGEILLPKNNRGLFVTNKFAMQLVGDDRYLLVMNFTPAASVSIIDTDKRQLIGEIPVPGCNMIYPTGGRGFSSMCGNGSMLSVQFDENGQQTEKHVTNAFFDVDDDPLFDKPAFLGTTAYFISYKGLVQPVDLSGAEPSILPSWSLLQDADRAANRRPAGWQVAASDGESKLYVIMQRDGFDGSHKSGGEQIWVADVESRQVVNRLDMLDGAFSIEVVPAASPLIAVTNLAMGLDVYEADGTRIRSLSLGDAAMPIALHRGR